VNRSRRNSDHRPSSRRPSRPALVAHSDEQLVELVLDGHDKAFEVLFERHVADSLWYAREVLGSWGEAEEAVRHSFAAAHAYLETRGHETEFAPWLHTILGNHCLSMLQARTPSPRESEDAAGAAVVDLGEWRLRRKLLGAALPIAPSAALRDGVMAACGIGAGAATAGTPLLGGMLANVAVVAVLAGGVGVAGNAASDRVAAVDASTPAPVVQVADAVSGSRIGIDSPREPADRSPLGIAVRGLESAPRATHEGFAPRERVRAEPSPAKSSPSTGARPPGPVLPELDPATVDVPAAIPPPVQFTLRHVVDVVETQVPAAGALSETRLPGSIDLSQIGDDLEVTAIESPVDVRALLSQEADAPPQ
jgi:hypothetical protein